MTYYRLQLVRTTTYSYLTEHLIDFLQKSGKSGATPRIFNPNRERAPRQGKAKRGKELNITLTPLNLIFILFMQEV